MNWKRWQIGMVLAGLLLFTSTMGWAGKDDDILGGAPNNTPGTTLKNKQTQLRTMKQQARCLQSCYDKGYKKFYGCGSDRRIGCNIRGDVSMRNCMVRCKATWFCRGFFKTQVQCPRNCMLTAYKKWSAKASYVRSRGRVVRRVVTAKMKQRWQRRAAFACKQTCTTLGKYCSLDMTTNPIKKSKFPWQKK